MSTNNEVALRLALEALENTYALRDDVIAAKASLRQAIAEAEKQEPVAWMQEGQSELYVKDEKDEKRGYVIPLYTTPPQQRPSRSDIKPLTDEQVDDLHGEANRGFCIEREDYFKAFRDAETAHGIHPSDFKEKNT
jgi:hypothetical protein